MSRFTTPLELTPDLASGAYRTVRDLAFDVGFLGSGLTITVPAGFRTDLASVPRWLWWLFPRDDPQYAAASVLHDYTYKWRHPASSDKFDRNTADGIYLDGMLILGVPAWRAWAMYLGVRIFGHRHWAGN